MFTSIRHASGAYSACWIEDWQQLLQPSELVTFDRGWLIATLFVAIISHLALGPYPMNINGIILAGLTFKSIQAKSTNNVMGHGLACVKDQCQMVWVCRHPFLIICSHVYVKLTAWDLIANWKWCDWWKQPFGCRNPCTTRSLTSC